MTKRLTYLLIFCAAVLLSGCSGLDPNKLFRESYSKSDTKPFGANIAYRQIKEMYALNKSKDVKGDFIDFWRNISDTNAVYFLVAPVLHVNTEEVDAMMDFVEAGNDLVISTAEFDELLLDRIDCREIFTDLRYEQAVSKMKNTSVYNTVKLGRRFEYYYYPFENYFSKYDSSKTRVLGYNDSKQPNSLVYFHGRGRMFIQCEPRAVSNYFLLKHSNYEYLQQVMLYAHPAPQHVYWDDYYYKLNYRKNDVNNDFSTFSELMKHPPLVYAFWISLALLVLYILFGGKRVQRIITEIKPNENTSLTFTETVGRLYLQKRDNKNIADKMITYFNEFIRNTYFVNTNHINNDFVTVLSRKSGLPKEQVDTLYRSIVATQGTAVVNDYQLMNLQDQIQNFYKNKA